MIAITSPAKTQDFESNWDTEITSQPEFLDEAAQLHEILKSKSKKELEETLDVSENLAELNYDRFQEWDSKHNKDNSKPSILAYQGDIYKQFQAENFSKTDQEYLQSHLRIISGFYGLVRPYDLIQAYRLEMKTELETEKGDNLYEFWGDKLTRSLNEKLDDFPEESRAIIDLASNEYLKTINQDSINGEFIKIEFRQKRDGELKNYGIYAKKARGAFIKYMKKTNLRELDQLKNFDLDGYTFLESESNSTQLFFAKKI